MNDLALRPFNVLSLCSGVGGLELGLKLAVPASRCVAHVEVEAYSAAILVSRMEEGAMAPAPLWSDIRTFDAKPWRGKVDIITAGYPCQSFSKAGRLKGEQDVRYLWPDVRRIIAECGPRFVFIENVANHIKHGFERTIRELQELGYRVAAGIFTAAEVGGCFEGERLFALAAAGDARVEGLFEGDYSSEPGPWRWRGEEDLSAIAESPLQPGNRFPQPILRRVDAQLADWLDQLRACGNGVHPLVAAYAFRTLVAHLTS